MFWLLEGEKLSKDLYPKNDVERNAMTNIPYASVIGSLMYAQVCTGLDLSFFVSVFGKYLSNLGQVH